MSDSGENGKYKWTPESTALLVSVWSDKQVQKQLDYASKPPLIWDGVARYMKKKGYNVTGKQCRSRMKQVLVCYREAKRAGTQAGVEQYYESIDRVLKNKRLGENLNGIDTVDAVANVKSPPKDVKTNKNLQMKQRFPEPVQSLYRTEALSPQWTIRRDTDYPDSPESNETILAKPCGMFSPTRDVAINTGEQLGTLPGKSVQCNFIPMEEPVQAHYKRNLLTNFPYGEIPYQNAVQNVQNHIIQENMQQHQNIQQNDVWNQQHMLGNNLGLQQNLHNLNQCLLTHSANVPIQHSVQVQASNLENIMQQQNRLQQNQLQQTVPVNKCAMPQEPRKIVYGQNLPAAYKQYHDALIRASTGVDMKQSGSTTPEYSPDVSQNLNDAFCQSSKTEAKTHNLNETFNQPLGNRDISTLTNNATCNDDSLILDYLLESPIPSETNKSKDSAVNTDSIPHVPMRKKKAQKLEQLVLSAISSQNEVVNKILAAQNDMVSRFLDVDRDRQNRLENRLDDLLKVVHASVLNKNSDSETEIPPPPPEPTITSLVPPPRPGVNPPKLDLVPPKPCRVPCTMPNSNIELINQNPVQTRPGVVSPITSPGKRPGTIWSKLGPVSQSPFVKAQQRLGIQPILSTEIRTQSSAERRIAKEMGNTNMDAKAIIFEANKLLESERQMEEKIENARLEMTMGHTLTARRRLFTQREPTAAMILTAAFLDAECQVSEQDVVLYNEQKATQRDGKKVQEDDLLAGQGESYERLRQLNIKPRYLPGEPCDSSTPAKLMAKSNNNEGIPRDVSRQTVQQLARLVMNSGRWKEIAIQKHQDLGPTTQINLQANANVCSADGNGRFAVPLSTEATQSQAKKTLVQDREDREWVRNKYIYENPEKEQNTAYARPQPNLAPPKPKFPIGFTKPMVDVENKKEPEFNGNYQKTIGFVGNVIPDRKQQNVRFMDEALAELHRMYMERISADQLEKNDSLPLVPGNANPVSPQSRQMIERYMNEVVSRKPFGDGKEKETDSDNDEEFLDTTGTIPTSIIPRRGSLTSSGTGSTETGHSMKFNKLHNNNCVIS